MKSSIIILSLFAAVYCHPNGVFEFEQLKDGGQHWALLVAGSNGYMNYRHQADVCHAYHVLSSHGIPDERIIVMMYDDIANNKENPEQDNIINQPDGPNVYKNVLKDYTGKDVNPETFLSVLKGDKGAVNGGKVIDSNENDHVFVNFVDHGAPGILGFGENYLKAKELMKAITYMNDNKRYAKMVFYVEACESGSMFEDLLPKDINVYATTASNPHESSFACYFDKTRKTYLGDVYSIKWMQDSDKENLKSETLNKQFKITKKEVNTSHVMEYGDLSIGDMTVAEFQGTQLASGLPRVSEPDPCADAVRSEDVPLEILRRSVSLAQTKQEARDIQDQLETLIKEREIVDDVTKMIVGGVSTHHTHSTRWMDRSNRRTIQNWDCYETVVDHLEDKCKQTLNIPKNDYALRKLYMFVNMCEELIPVEVILEVIDKVCTEMEI